MPVRCKETRQFMMVSTRMGVLCLVTCLVSDPTVSVRFTVSLSGDTGIKRDQNWMKTEAFKCKCAMWL